MIAGFVYAYVFVRGYFIEWTSLGQPPEKPIEILAINNGPWIKVESGNYYHFDYFKDGHGCQVDCWVEVTKAPDKYPDLLPIEIESSKCASLYSPRLGNFVESKSACVEWPHMAYGIVIYAIDQDGTVYSWQNIKGDQEPLKWLAFVQFPLIGGMGGFLIYSCAILVKLLQQTSKTLLMRK